MKRISLRLLPCAALAVLVPLAGGLRTSPAPTSTGHLTGGGLEAALQRTRVEQEVVRAERTVRMLRDLHAGLEAMQEEPQLEEQP